MIRGIAFVLREATNTFRAGLVGPLVPLVFVGVIGYLGVVIVSADYMQEIGAVDIPRNSPHVVYLMIAGGAFYLAFAWAWLFASAALRDRHAGMHELVLSTPISLPELLSGRFLGALGLAVLLGAASPVAFLMVHPLHALGALPADAVGPVPWGAMAMAWSLFTVTTAVGMGALSYAAVLQTGKTGAAFAVASGLVALWMVAVVVLQEAGIAPALASIVDPTGYAELIRQTGAWTPAEKRVGPLVMTLPFVVNRALWVGPPVLVLGWVIRRLRREDLLGKSNYSPSTAVESGLAKPVTAKAPPAPSHPIGPGGWVSATLLEARWHFIDAVRSWGLGLAAALLLVIGVSGSMVHLVGHAEGPLVPRPEIMTPFLGDFVYLMLAFLIAGFVGALMRRDEVTGWQDVFAVSPAPLGVRLLGKAFASFTLTIGLVAVSSVSGVLVTAMLAPESLYSLTSLLYTALVLAPAILEICGATILLHALIRSTGAAYASSMIVTFAFVLNHEVGLTVLPHTQIGVPAEVTLSELVGWSPWLPFVTGLASFKLALVALLVGLAWLTWPRSVHENSMVALLDARYRMVGGAGALCGAAILILVGFGSRLHTRLVVEGDFNRAKVDDHDRALWERQGLESMGSFTIESGDVQITVEPDARRVQSRWTLRGLSVDTGVLSAQMPAGVTVRGATVANENIEVLARSGMIVVPLDGCLESPPTACEVVLDIEVVRQGWPFDGATPWLHPRQVSLQAHDVLPKLGVDPERWVRTPPARQALGLPVDVAASPTQGLASAKGVAPAGTWTYHIDLPDGWHTSATGETSGPLDFAVLWRPTAPAQTVGDHWTAWHGSTRESTARAVLNDVEEMAACLERTTGWPRTSGGTVLQAPRGGTPALRGDVLWLPEDAGWDVADEGPGRWRRRFSIAKALATDSLVRRSDLRREFGSRWLDEGVAGWLALACIRTTDGDDAWVFLSSRTSDAVARALGTPDAPVHSLARDGDAAWISAYAPAATFAWAERVGRDNALRIVERILGDLNDGASVREALTQELGAREADELLGPPLASDLVVHEPKAQQVVSADGQRWRWNRGGWHQVDAPRRILRLDARSTTTVSVPNRLDVSEPFIVIDAWPSFERNVHDNIWKGAWPD
ncbi:MAG: hypothetical protein AAGA48_18415 [Myxococcota bacterium]